MATQVVYDRSCDRVLPVAGSLMLDSQRELSKASVSCAGKRGQYRSHTAGLLTAQCRQPSELSPILAARHSSSWRQCSRFSTPQGAQLVSQQKPEVVNETFGGSTRRPPGKCQSASLPVVTATATSPHAYVCLYMLFYRFFFSLSLSRCRESRAPIAGACIHQCSTCA